MRQLAVTAGKSNIRDNQWFWTGLNGYLARNALKQTKQRQFIIEKFLAIDGHVDADGLRQTITAGGLRVGLATIYRTLNLMTSAGLVEQKTFADGRSMFELIRPDHHHDHLICVDCGTVTEFENSDIESIQHRVAKQNGFELVNHRLDLYGRCLKKNCVHRKRANG